MSCEVELPIPVDCPITIYIGVTFGPLLVKIVDDVNGDPVDISQYACRAEVRVVPQYPTAYFNLLPTITDGPAGFITIEVPPEDTITLVPMEGFWDLVLIDPVGKRIGPTVGGTATITYPISRSP